MKASRIRGLSNSAGAVRAGGAAGLGEGQVVDPGTPDRLMPIDELQGPDPGAGRTGLAGDQGIELRRALGEIGHRKVALVIDHRPGGLRGGVDAVGPERITVDIGPLDEAPVAAVVRGHGVDPVALGVAGGEPEQAAREPLGADAVGLIAQREDVGVGPIALELELIAGGRGRRGRGDREVRDQTVVQPPEGQDIAGRAAGPRGPAGIHRLRQGTPGPRARSGWVGCRTCSCWRRQ